MSFRTSVRLAALTTVVGAGLLAVPATADAAIAHYTPQSVCGSSYGTRASFNLPGGTSTVYLTYSGSTGKNCVVTIKNSRVGTPTLTGAYITYGDGSGRQQDAGNYSSYAGPVYLYAPGQCIYFGGEDYNSGGWWGEGPGWCG
ncbi:MULTISPECIES: spore-associated protein [Kitasatospora]|uniref:Spore-associated protein A n=1 Tax=Kitasatospora cystarginea TaxID=58350 RepID=A0ABP5R6P3_9ACTN